MILDHYIPLFYFRTFLPSPVKTYPFKQCKNIVFCYQNILKELLLYRPPVYLSDVQLIFYTHVIEA